MCERPLLLHKTNLHNISYSPWVGGMPRSAILMFTPPDNSNSPEEEEEVEP